MRVVLYDEETLEPLTVLNLPIDPRRLADSGACRHFTFPIPMPFLMTRSEIDESIPRPIPVVHIWFEKIEHTHRPPLWLALTKEVENALLLRSVFLPGQRKEVREEYERGIVDGLMRALGG